MINICSCIKGGEEPLSAVILGGRHPGQYFLNGGETLDYLVNTEVCNTLVQPGDLQAGTDIWRKKGIDNILSKFFNSSSLWNTNCCFP